MLTILDLFTIIACLSATLINLALLGMNIKLYSEIVKTSKLTQIAEQTPTEKWK